MGTIHRLQSDLDESECDFLIDVLLGKGIDTSAKKFDVNSRTVLKKLGAKKGDRITIYMPMIPEAAYAMLACTR